MGSTDQTINTRSGFIKKVSELAKLREEALLANKKIVFTYGTFDLLHSGHATFLAQAKEFGDILVVGVSSNRCKQDLRGKGFPLIHQKNRSELLSYFDFVDYVVVVDDRNLSSVLKKLKPKIFYTLTLDWKSHLRKPEEEKILKKYGGKIIKVKPSLPFISSSDIVERVADLKIKEIVEYFFGKVKIDLTKGNWKRNKFSGLKTDVRDDSIYFGNHLERLGLFGNKFIKKLLNKKTLITTIEKHKRLGDKIVLTSGSCDLVHAGHVRFFSKAKDLGDILLLCIPSDHIIRKQKGRGRPIINEKSRAELMSFFNCVDYIYIFESDSVEPIVEITKPDIFFTVQEEWNDISKSNLNDMIKKWGGKIVTAPPQSSGISSSKLIRKAAGIRVRQVFKEVLDEAEKWNSLKD